MILDKQYHIKIYVLGISSLKGLSGFLGLLKHFIFHIYKSIIIQVQYLAVKAVVIKYSASAR